MTGELVYLGCYTAESGGRGEGVTALRRDPLTGALESLGTAARTPSPSFLTRHPALPVLYAVNELPEGRVSAWRIAADGSLAPLGGASTGGDSPCHLAVDPGGRRLYVANYGSGSVAVHPLGPDGSVGDRTDLLVHDGHGPDPDRQEQAHAHMVAPDPAGGGLLAVDLGTDTVYPYEVDGTRGRLVPRHPRIHLRPGTGPRHLARHPDGRRWYVVGELDGSVTAYRRDADGVVHESGRVPASGRSGHVQPSEVAVRPDGRFLYVANRGVGTVSVLALDDGSVVGPGGGTGGGADDAGLPRLVAEVDTAGTWPRHFALVGRHLYVADERADAVAVFTVDPATGTPEPAGPPLGVPSPTCVLS